MRYQHVASGHDGGVGAGVFRPPEADARSGRVQRGLRGPCNEQGVVVGRGKGRAGHEIQKVGDLIDVPRADVLVEARGLLKHTCHKGHRRGVKIDGLVEARR